MDCGPCGVQTGRRSSKSLSSSYLLPSALSCPMGFPSFFCPISYPSSVSEAIEWAGEDTSFLSISCTTWHQWRLHTIVWYFWILITIRREIEESILRLLVVVILIYSLRYKHPQFTSYIYVSLHQFTFIRCRLCTLLLSVMYYENKVLFQCLWDWHGLIPPWRVIWEVPCNIFKTIYPIFSCEAYDQPIGVGHTVFLRTTHVLLTLERT